jgi:hypothetical protein
VQDVASSEAPVSRRALLARSTRSTPCYRLPVFKGMLEPYIHTYPYPTSPKFPFQRREPIKRITYHGVLEAVTAFVAATLHSAFVAATLHTTSRSFKAFKAFTAATLLGITVW